MATLLSILLYLALIVSPGTYYDDEIADIEQTNQTQIDAILADQQLTNQIVSDYADEVAEVVVLERQEEY